MRFPIIIIFFISISIGKTIAETSDLPISDRSPIFYNYIGKHIKSTALQFSIYSYRPSLEGFTNTLQNFGVENNLSALMPTLSIVLKHSTQLDSRIEIGYWQKQLETLPPNTNSLTATLIPISYQLIYRPVLLYEYLPIYLGAGFGTLRAEFQGNIVDLLEVGGISLANDASTTIGYVILGFELLKWQSQNLTPTSIGKNASINLELKRILKTIETTGTQPLNVILDGTAIGISVSSQF